MSKADASPPPPKRKKVPWALLIGGPITLILLALVIRTALAASWRSEGDATLAELKADGLGVDNLRPDPPAKNGAPEVHEAYLKIENLPFASDRLDGTRPSLLKAALLDPSSEATYTMGGPWSQREPIEEAIQPILTQLSLADPHLERAFKQEILYVADWDKGIHADLSFIMEVRRLVSFLQIRAGWRSVQGNAPAAYADLERCLLLSQSLRSAQLVTRMFQISAAERSVEILEDLLCAGQLPTPAVQTRLLKLLKELSKIDGVTYSLRGELQSFSVMSDEIPVLGSDESEPAGSNLLWGYWRKEHFRIMAELIRASQEPPQEFRTYVKDLEARLPEEGNPLSRLLVPTLSKFLVKGRRSRTRLRLAIWALKLAPRPELPLESEGAPLDPFTFDTKPMNYRREGRGALFWSVGKDERDARGVSGLAGGLEGGPDDVTFRILRK